MTVTADAADNVGGQPACSSRRRRRDRRRGHDRALRAAVGHAHRRRTAHTRSPLGPATPRATRTLSAPVTVNVANTELVPERDPGDRLQPADEHRVPARRAHARRGARRHDQGAAAALHAGRPDAVPAAHQRRLGRRAAGHLRHRARPELRDEPLLLRLLHARVRRTATGCRASRPTRPSPARSPAASSSSTRIPRTPTPSTTAAPSTSATTGRSTSRPASTSTPASPSSSTNPRGKIHRINPDGTVPTDNPFYDGAGPHWDSIWAYGLRNPYRAYYDAPDRAAVHRRRRRQRLLDRRRRRWTSAQAGANYGWPNCEGNCPAPVHEPDLLLPAQRPRRGHHRRLRLPRHAVPGVATRAATSSPTTRRTGSSRLTFDANGNVTGVFNFEPAGRLGRRPVRRHRLPHRGPRRRALLRRPRLLRHQRHLRRQQDPPHPLRRRSNQPPVAVAAGQPDVGTGPAHGELLERGLVGSRGPAADLLVDVRRRHDLDGGQPHPHLRAGRPVHGAADGLGRGQHHAVRARSRSRVGAKPTATILTPQDGIFFKAGDVISFSGDATDPEDGTLPASAFTWNIDFLHDGHVHPGIPADRREERHVHHPDHRARLQRQHPLPHHADRDRLERADGHEDRHGLADEGEPDLRHRADRPDALPRRHRQDDAVRLRHAGRLQPHHRGAQPERRLEQLHVRVLVRRRRAAAHDRRARRRADATRRPTT